MHKLALITIVAFVAGGGVGTKAAVAHNIKTATPIAKLTLKQQKWLWQADIKHAQKMVRHFKPLLRKPVVGNWRLLSYVVDSYAKNQYRYHSHLLQYAIRKLKAVNIKLAVRQYPVPRNIYNAFLCIHSHEGSWSDSGDPYWGGLQMDRSFMNTYGYDMIKRYGGYANIWPPDAQVLVAYRAFSGFNGFGGRGFYPWPNTARACGLI